MYKILFNFNVHFTTNYIVHNITKIKNENNILIIICNNTIFIIYTCHIKYMNTQLLNSNHKSQ